MLEISGFVLMLCFLATLWFMVSKSISWSEEFVCGGIKLNFGHMFIAELYKGLVYFLLSWFLFIDIKTCIPFLNLVSQSSSADGYIFAMIGILIIKVPSIILSREMKDISLVSIIEYIYALLLISIYFIIFTSPLK